MTIIPFQGLRCRTEHVAHQALMLTTFKAVHWMNPLISGSAARIRCKEYTAAAHMPKDVAV